MHRTPAPVSFVIPAHDEARLLGATLDALHAAADALGLEYEIVVADDASTDATADIARSRGARVLHVAHRQIAATRNAGARAARHDVLVFVDADTLVDPPVLAAALQALEDGAVGGGAAVDFIGPLSPHERLLAVLAQRAFRRTGIAPGCFVFCTRAAFEAAGGFDETWYAGEDVAISRALAKQGRFTILREAVRTSERKLRSYGARDHLRLLWRFALRGRRILRDRDALGLWYGPRRE
jgi:glycosyltransferase involved in cell wall biosynthesis